MQKGNEKNLSEAGIETMLGNLPRVEAPMNFESRVRSRIADRKEESTWSPGWLLGLKFALPALALVLLGVFFLFPGDWGVEQGSVPLPAGAETETATNNAVVPDAPGPIVETPVRKDALTARAVNGQQNANTILPGGKTVAAEQPGGGSIDQAVNPPSPTLYPEGVDPTKADVGNLKPPTGNGISAEAILSMIGIRSECKKNGCPAAAVSKQSIAEKAGVKPGDLIEAIDEKPVKAGTVFEGTINVRSLRVLRGGKRVTINLNAK